MLLNKYEEKLSENDKSVKDLEGKRGLDDLKNNPWKLSTFSFIQMPGLNFTLTIIGVSSKSPTHTSITATLSVLSRK